MNLKTPHTLSFPLKFACLTNLSNWLNKKKRERKKGKKRGPVYNGILFPKLVWSSVSDWEKILKFKAEGREFVKLLRSLEQFIQTVKVQNNFW